MKAGFVSLGCSKNLVDSEMMLGILREHGIELTPEPAEADISVAVASEAFRYVSDGYPIRVVYPADGTAYLLTGAGILAQCSEADRQAAGRLIDWLLSDEAQLALASQGFYFLTTNPATLAYQSFPGKNIVLFRQFPRFTEVEKHAFLDRWVKYIRFSSP